MLDAWLKTAERAFGAGPEQCTLFFAGFISIAIEREALTSAVIQEGGSYEC